MTNETLSEAIIARTRVLNIHAKRRFMSNMRIVCVFVYLCFILVICIGQFFSVTSIVISLGVIPMLLVILNILTEHIFDNYLTKYYRHALNDEYNLIPGTMTYLDTMRMARANNIYRWTGGGHNYGPLHSLNISGVGHPVERVSYNYGTTMYVKVNDYQEVKIRINSVLLREFRCNKPVYLIEWHNEKRGIIDTYDFYIPEPNEI